MSEIRHLRLMTLCRKSMERTGIIVGPANKKMRTTSPPPGLEVNGHPGGEEALQCVDVNPSSPLVASCTLTTNETGTMAEAPKVTLISDVVDCDVILPNGRHDSNGSFLLLASSPGEPVVHEVTVNEEGMTLESKVISEAISSPPSEQLTLEAEICKFNGKLDDDVEDFKGKLCAVGDCVDSVGANGALGFSYNQFDSCPTTPTHVLPLERRESPKIRDVWAHNLREEFKVIRQRVNQENFSIIAMDTEFPGVVTYPMGACKTNKDYQYQLVRANCDTLRLIQVGLSLMDESGNTPPGVSTWQFNFKFNLSEDMYAENSIKLLKNCGIKFEKHATDGIDSDDFAEMLLSSGLVLENDEKDVKWVSFHGGYDLGYLCRLLSGMPLPAEETEFIDTLEVYFPNLYDIKYLLEDLQNYGVRGGLQYIANVLNVKRVGMAHQAGSDSLMTGETYFRIKKIFFKDRIDESKYNGRVFGFNGSYASNE